MNINFILRILLLLLISLRSVYSWRSFIISFNNITCSKKSDAIAFVNCSVVKINRYESALNLYAETAQDLPKAYIDLSFSYPRPGQDDFVGLNVTKIDACEFIEAKVGLNMVQIIRNDLKKYAILPERCPFPKGTIVSISNYRFNAENLPPYVLEHIFNMRIHLWYDKIPLAEVLIAGACEQKRKRQGAN